MADSPTSSVKRAENADRDMDTDAASEATVQSRVGSRWISRSAGPIRSSSSAPSQPRRASGCSISHVLAVRPGGTQRHATAVAQHVVPPLGQPAHRHLQPLERAVRRPRDAPAGRLLAEHAPGLHRAAQLQLHALRRDAPRPRAPAPARAARGRIAGQAVVAATIGSVLSAVILATAHQGSMAWSATRFLEAISRPGPLADGQVGWAVTWSSVDLGLGDPLTWWCTPDGIVAAQG